MSKSKFVQLLSTFFIGVAVFGFVGKMAIAEPTLASQTLVVYNRNDPDSSQLARYYAARREIPDQQVVGLKCADTEEITRDEYDSTIARPLIKQFETLGWWERGSAPGGKHPLIKSKIRFVALIRGVPLKIRQNTTYPGDQPDPKTPYGATNAASVDSELTVLARMSPQISGPMTNPYFENFDRFTKIELPEMMLVCRLDGPSADDVKRMIDDSLRAEKSGLWGWVFLDERGTTLPGYKMGDDWMKKAGGYFAKEGFPVFTDYTEAILPTGLPIPKTAIYFGWYSSDMAGAFTGTGVRLVPGAIACHIHSFSATTLRSRSVGWCGPLVASGAAAVLGNVYEPYLTLTANLDIFSERLLGGFTFAESAWASLRTVSWMNVSVGDPLYRPYATLSNSNVDFGVDFEDFRRSAKRGMVNSDKGFSAEAWAQRKLAEGDDAAAEFLFQEALKKYSDPDSIARTAWEYGEFLIQKGRKDAAITMLKSTEKKIRGSGAGNFLLTRILTLEPPPPPVPTQAATPVVPKREIGQPVIKGKIR